MFFSKKKKFVGKTVDELGTSMLKNLEVEIENIKKRVNNFAKIKTGGNELLNNKVKIDISTKILEKLLS